jgi:hypothetical protein
MDSSPMWIGVINMGENCKAYAGAMEACRKIPPGWKWLEKMRAGEKVVP